MRSSSHRSSSTRPSRMRATRSSRARSPSAGGSGSGRSDGSGSSPVPGCRRCSAPASLRRRSPLDPASRIRLGAGFVAGFGRRTVGASGPCTGPAGDGRPAGRFGHHAAHPHDEQGDGVLARQLAAGARAPPRDVDVIDRRLVRLGPRPTAATPQRPVVAPQTGPPLRHRDRPRPRPATTATAPPPPPARSSNARSTPSPPTIRQPCRTPASPPARPAVVQIRTVRSAAPTVSTQIELFDWRAHGDDVGPGAKSNSWNCCADGVEASRTVRLACTRSRRT